MLQMRVSSGSPPHPSCGTARKPVLIDREVEAARSTARYTMSIADSPHPTTWKKKTRSNGSSRAEEGVRGCSSAGGGGGWARRRGRRQKGKARLQDGVFVVVHVPRGGGSAAGDEGGARPRAALLTRTRLPSNMAASL